MVCPFLLVAQSLSLEEAKKRLEIHGKIAEFSQVHYRKIQHQKSDSIKILFFDKTSYEFDEKGHFVQTKAVRADSVLRYKEIYSIKPQKDSFWVSELERFEKDNQRVWWIVYTYNAQNQLIEYENKLNNDKTTYQYDPRGNQIAKIHNVSLANASQCARVEFTYDTENRITELTGYARNQSISHQWKYSYPKNQKKSAYYLNKVQPDEEAKIKMELQFEDIEEFNADNQRIKYEHISYKHLHDYRKCTYSYDSMGKMNGMYTFDKDSKITKTEIIEYEYDQQGNWTKKTVITPNLSYKHMLPEVEVWERQIKYYP
jgi:YD repeat-containing protein